MHQTVTRIAKWTTIPVLLIVAALSSFAGSYEPVMDFAVCLVAVYLANRAMRLREYFWSAGFVGILILFSPIFLVVKLFLLLGLTSAAACITLFVAFRTQLLPVEQLP